MANAPLILFFQRKKCDGSEQKAKPLVCICSSGTHLIDITRAVSVAKGLARTVALSGAARSNGCWLAEWVPYCEAPIVRSVRTPDRYGGRPYETALLVACKKCAQCRQFRQMEWRQRILNEMEKSLYTYFLTLTFSEAHLAGVMAESFALDKYEGEKGFEHSAWKNHVRLYLGRLRKGRSKKVIHAASVGSQGRNRFPFQGLKFRYFGVAEYGDERGRLHFHMVLHTDRWIPAEILTNEWRSRADAQLVKSQEGLASYVSKYLTKSLTIGRPRASGSYGIREPDLRTLMEGKVPTAATTRPPPPVVVDLA